MAITFDNNLSASISSGSSQTVSFTVGSSSNSYLVVGIIIQGGFTCTGVTYGGVSMTQLTSVSASGVTSGETNYLFGLASPASGANNIVASYSGTSTNAVSASSFAGAQSTTAVEGSNTATGSSNPASVSVTTITNNDWLVGFARGQSNTTAGTNTTIRGVATNINMMDSNGAQTPPGSFSLNFTDLSNNAWAAMAIALQPAATAANGNFLSFM
jgi:hypothetical protein